MMHKNILKVMHKNILKVMSDFPGSPVVKNLPSNAGDTDSIPGQGTKIPHAVGQLSPCTATIELACLNERARVLQTTEPTCSEAHTPQLERSPCAKTKSPLRNERSRMPQLRPDAAKKFFKRK